VKALVITITLTKPVMIAFGTHPLMLGLVFALVTFIVGSEAQTAHAAEGAVDYYVPGLYGNFGLADLPDPGFYYFNYTLYQNGEKDTAVRQGRVQVDIEDDIAANAFVPVYIFDQQLFGAQVLIGAAMIYMGISEDIGVDSGKGTDVTVSTGGLEIPRSCPLASTGRMMAGVSSFMKPLMCPLGNGISITGSTWGITTGPSIRTWEPRMISPGGSS
jgi:hypothetical protein